MKSKIEELKEVFKNPPPERLAKIEYQSHALQAIGILIVCVVLIFKGYWYIIFALIFGVGISYSQGMTAYQKYKAIMSFKEPEKIENYEKDISWTRRRSKIVKHVLGNSANFGSVIIAVMIAFLIIDPTNSRWLLMIYYPLVISVTYFLFYFYICYWISIPVYKEKVEKIKKKKIKLKGGRIKWMKK